MIDIKNKAHEYLINKGVRTIADKFSAKTIEDMLIEFTQQINKLNIADVSKSAFKIDKNKAISDITKDFCKHYNLSENIEKDLLKLNSYCWIDGVHSC